MDKKSFIAFCSVYFPELYSGDIEILWGKCQREGTIKELLDNADALDNFVGDSISF